MSVITIVGAAFSNKSAVIKEITATSAYKPSICRRSSPLPWQVRA